MVIAKDNYLFPVCLFFFKLINKKHIKNFEIKKIIKIKGYRTILYEDKYGQRITSEFIWWIFLNKTEKRWVKNA